MDKKSIAETSLRFLNGTFDSEDSIHRISLLPFSKEEIREAIGEYVQSEEGKLVLTTDEINSIKICYGSLSNFIADEQANLVNTVNEELGRIDPRNLVAIKEWLSNPINDEKYRQVIKLMTQTVTEREKLRQEFDAFILKK
ncbi:MAG: hypothetical protein NTV48_02835 [Candidatus Vogelbacteria bacterium]|nr:hypothetical protein [Candidatus Vogelbacteria bacterium]